MQELITTLREGANGIWNLGLSEEQLAQFQRYAEMLVDWNAHRLNLTRITEPREIAVKHFLDSLAVLQAVAVAPEARVIDIGTGAGLPGLALKIARPDIRLTLMDSTAKKITFCRAVADDLTLTQVTTRHGRAEEAGRQPGLRGQFDYVLARAVAPLERLIPWCAPFAAPEGVLVALKGPSAAEEWPAARPIAQRLGFQLTKYTLTLPASEETLLRQIVLARRISERPR